MTYAEGILPALKKAGPGCKNARAHYRWPALLEGRPVFCIRDADANVLLPQALPATPISWRYRPRHLPPPQPRTLAEK